MSSILFSRWAGTSLNMGLKMLDNNHDIRLVGPLVLETLGLIFSPWSSLWVLIS
jgi:hypothetical protein